MIGEPKELNIPLNKRHYFDVWLFIGYIAISAYIIKPHSLAGWVVTLVMVAPSFWLGFSGPSFLSNWASQSRYIFASWIVFFIRVLFAYFFVFVAAPIVISFIESWLHV